VDAVTGVVTGVTTLWYCDHMREIGVRDLKRSLSETLRAVERGEQVRVTVRGRAIATSFPPAPGGRR